MKNSIFAVLVISLVTNITACTLSPAQRAKYERSGCTQASIFDGCNPDKSYEWNRRHGHIKDDYNNDDYPKESKQHNREKHMYDYNHGMAGINGKFAGNYEARFVNGQHSADIYVEDSGVYLNGNEIRDTNMVNGTLTFRVGYATYTIKAESHRGIWKDEDSGNSGYIVSQ